jgi:hypothetical protein
MLKDRVVREMGTQMSFQLCDAGVDLKRSEESECIQNNQTLISGPRAYLEFYAGHRTVQAFGPVLKMKKGAK